MGQPNLPNPVLKNLDRLVGTWHVGGPIVNGEVTFRWFEGGFFLVQTVDLTHDGIAIKGVEYIGYDESSGTCTSHFFDSAGHVFAYSWEVEGDSILIWFGTKGSNNWFAGKFNEDGNSYSGAWKWPGGGYHATLTRIT